MACNQNICDKLFDQSQTSTWVSSRPVIVRKQSFKATQEDICDTQLIHADKSQYVSRTLLVEYAAKLCSSYYQWYYLPHSIRNVSKYNSSKTTIVRILLNKLALLCVQKK